ncbi:MAG: DUF2490 domain-containing protein [Cyclobacteriaceae bacterium]
MKTRIIALLILGLGLNSAIAQKAVKHQNHVWVSTNNIIRVTDRIGVSSAIHVRRNDFLKDPNFYFLLNGLTYWVNPSIRVTAGYIHMWNARNVDADLCYANERRPFQELVVKSNYLKATTMFRVRNEQRFKEVMATEQEDRYFKYNTRVRMLLQAKIPITKGANPLQFKIVNELMINLGEHDVFNTFDQNRFSIGVQQKFLPNWSADLCYMGVYQQLSAGDSYNMNHTLRLFFFGTIDLRK